MPIAATAHPLYGRIEHLQQRPLHAHRPLLESQDLAAILCRREERTVANDYTFRVDRQVYQIDLQAVAPALRQARVAVQFRLDGSIRVNFQNRLLEAQLCQPGDPPAGAPSAPTRPVRKRRRSRPGSNWGRNFNLKDAPPLSKTLAAEKKAGRL